MDPIDASVSRHLQKKFELGLFENPYADEGRVLELFDTPKIMFVCPVKVDPLK